MTQDKIIKALRQAAIQNALAHNERIVCTNATVIADETGQITGWYDNDKPFVVLKEDEIISI